MNGIINQAKHDKVFKNSRERYTKYPPAFGIDLHVDDSVGVAMEGAKGGFEVLRISPDDNRWTKKVLHRVLAP